MAIISYEFKVNDNKAIFFIHYQRWRDIEFALFVRRFFRLSQTFQCDISKAIKYIKVKLNWCIDINEENGHA